MKKIKLSLVAILLGLTGCDTLPDTDQSDFMAVVSRPDTLNIIDLETNTIVRQCKLPSPPAPGTVEISPDRQTVYVLTDSFSDVYGYNVETCEVVFSTQQTVDNVRVKSMFSMALSLDGNEIYTHQNRVHLHSNRYEVLPTKVAVFNTSNGLNTRATRSFDAPRQITTMAVTSSGEILLGGADIYAMNTKTGNFKVILESLNISDPDPLFGPRDVLTAWPLHFVNQEYIRLFSAMRFQDESQNMETADLVWGYEKVDLGTGQATSKVFGSSMDIIFSGMRRPGQLEKVYTSLSQLKQFDVKTQRQTKSILLEHSYYCLNFSTDGNRIYLSGALNDIAVYDADSMEKITNIQLPGDMSLANSVIFKRSAIKPDDALRL